MKRINPWFICQGALIAATYVVLNAVSLSLGLAFGPIQLRLSEMLALLPAFTPAAIPGLSVGCFLANLASPNAADLLVGTIATLFAAILTRMLAKITFRGLPFLAPLPPVVVNAVFVGLELSLLTAGGFSPGVFAVFSLQIAAGQTVVCYLFGLPLGMLIRRKLAKIKFEQI